MYFKEDRLMGKGLHIVKKNHYLDSSTQKSGELQLLGKGDGAEVLLQKVDANVTIFIEPGENIELMEFFYVLEGELKFVDSNKYLNKGDCFYSHCLSDPVELRTLTDIVLLYFTTRPIFHHLSTTIQELVRLTESIEDKDYYTHDHTLKVKDYATRIGNKLGLSKGKIENIGFAAILHDIGKIDIPDKILKKPGKLTEEEFEIIKQHPIIGAEKVKATYYENLSDIILQHHERIDGTGYPYGLQGDEIMIEAQVIAMADTYHAMISDRPYRKGLHSEDIVQELKELSGKHYDEKIVHALLEILKEDDEI